MKLKDLMVFQKMFKLVTLIKNLKNRNLKILNKLMNLHH